jgi:hypothetical protein
MALPPWTWAEWWRVNLVYRPLHLLGAHTDPGCRGRSCCTPDTQVRLPRWLW